jgi:hypothetical protein
MLTFLADAIVVLWYIVVFGAALIVIVGAGVIFYLEINGYFEEIKQDRKDAETLRRAEEYRSDFE